jgi:hypothetical protein
MKNFDSYQQQYYTTDINRAVPSTRSPLSSDTINAALGNIDTLITSANTPEPIQLLTSMGRDSPAMRRDEECRKNLLPNTGIRDTSARTGCGWWFVSNPNVQSVSAYGSRRGPMSPTLDRDIGAGKWVWDMNEAMRLEGVKQTKKLKVCEDLQFSQYPNMGWCPSTSRAIVTDGRGNPAYPRSAGGDCPDGGIISSYQQCPPPPTPDTPSATPALLNAAQSQSISWICKPKTDGSLTPACLRALNNLGCSDKGTLSMALSSGYAGESEVFNDMNSVLAERGFKIPNGILKDGKMTIWESLGFTNILRAAAANADNSRGALAAKNMCFGTPFDPCSFTPSDKGPYGATCITKWALSVGWSPKGRALPEFIGAKAWDDIPTMRDVMTILLGAKQLADTPGPRQAEMIMNVYGVGIKYPQNVCPA